MHKKQIATLFIVFFVGCSQLANNPSIINYDQLGFQISINGNYDSTVNITISTSQIPKEIPTVYVNEKELTPNGLFYWSDQANVNDKIIYRICWDGDVLTDTIKIPAHIDSVFCNGKYIHSFSYDTGLYPAVTISDSIKFNWKHDSNSSYYDIYFSIECLNRISQLIENYSFDSIAFHIDSNFTDYPTRIYFEIVNVINPLLSGAKANIESNKMFAFYDFKGNPYRGFIELNK